MKKLLLLITLALAASSANAQFTSRTQSIKCFNLDDLAGLLTKWKEEPVFIMDIMMYNSDGDLMPYETIFTINGETRRWSLIRQASDTVACIQAAGENFRFLDMNNLESPKKKDML